MAIESVRRIPRVAPATGTSNFWRQSKRVLGRDWPVAYLFIAPLVILLFGLIAYPLIRGVILSFYNVTGITNRGFVGFQNYERLWENRQFRESVKIVRQVLDGLPEGPISSRPGVKSVGQVRIPKGEGYTRVEGARGEVGCYVVADGGPKPYRLKWRGASFSNLAVLPHIIPGHKVADVVAIMGSVDPVFGEVDR